MILNSPIQISQIIISGIALQKLLIVQKVAKANFSLIYLQLLDIQYMGRLFSFFLRNQNINFLYMSGEDNGLEPSVLDPSRFNLRNKGLRTSNGRLYKGCVKDAYTKLSIGSIPSNYESIIYHHQEKKGFGTGQKRFYNAQTKSQFIGTQLETDENSTQSSIQTSASYSKKGYGPFIAKQQRQWRHYPHSPGPGKYFDCKQFFKTIQTQKRPYFAKQKQELKRKSIILNKQNYDNPGPGHYDAIELDGKHKYQGCRSAFVTKQKRQTYIQTNLTPGPGSYVLNSPEMKLPPKRQMLQNELFSKLAKENLPKTKHFIPKRKNVQIPGPGYYDYEEPDFKPLYERVKISNNFVQSNKDRFNDPIQENNEEPPKSPNPCSYKITSNFDKIEKRLIDMSSFMSESKRQPFIGSGLGPNLANDGSNKESKNFHFNIRGQWL